jgi:sn-glycerol 3-phosphate transport system permease protein
MSESAPASTAVAAASLDVDAPKRRRARYHPGEVLAAYLCLAPSLVVFAAFAYYPLYQLFVESTHQSNAFGTRTRYVGFGQLGDVLTGSEFSSGLGHTLLYVLYTVPAGLILGILLAVAAHRQLRGIKIVQTIFSSTVATSVAVTSVIFLTLINPSAGVLKIDILNNRTWALFGVSWSSMWQNIGLAFIIVLAGLQAIPSELLEAATLDGFGPIRRFFKVTLPLLSPVLLFLVVVLVVFALQSYAQVDILTQGGPAGATETLVYKITQNQNPRLISTGAAMSIGLFGVTLVITALQFVLLNKRVHYDT